MPQNVKIQLPIVTAQQGTLFLARPIGFPEIAIVASRREQAIESVRRQVVKTVRQYLASDLLTGLVRGPVESRQIEIEFQPRKRDPGWRQPVSLDFEIVCWNIEDLLRVALVPALDLRVVASPHTDFDKLIEEQIRATMLRRDLWSLQGLRDVSLARWNHLIQSPLTVTVDTPSEHQRRSDTPRESTTPTLRAVATRVGKDNIRPTVGRGDEIQHLEETLAAAATKARPRRSVLLVGPSGVGKTAIFHAWVNRVIQDSGKSAPPIWATDGSRLISGQSGFGGWQQQCMALVDESRKTGAIVHLGNAMELSESGKSWGSGGCGSALAPRIADGSLTAILECTTEQYDQLSRTEPRLIACLTRIDVKSADAQQTRDILLDAAASWKPIDVTAQIRQRLRKQRASRRGKKKSRSNTVPENVLPRVQPEALLWIDRLHRRFPTELASPGRSLNFFETVMSELFVLQVAQAREGGESIEPLELDTAAVMKAFSRQTGLPPFLIDPSVRPDLNTISTELKSQVLGQDHVIEVLVDLIAVLATDLSRGDRPLASLMMIGPTGVGKTETAKAMARLIYSDVSRLVRIDMSEYADPLAASRLIGGIDGDGRSGIGGGVLTSAIQAQPFSLILLDEFEKAHPAVFDLLLQVLGEGRLTDRHGRVADFRNTIIMMTSNLGVEDLKEKSLGLSVDQPKDLVQRQTEHFHRKVREFLRPEMYNRLDRILAFQSLAPETILILAERQIQSLSGRDGILARKATMSVDDQVTKRISEHGYQPQYGARPLARQIERELMTPIALQMVEHRQAVGFHVDLENQQIKVHPLHSDPSARQASADDQLNEKTLIHKITDMRRRCQSLLDCDSYRDLRTRYTRLQRKAKRNKAIKGNQNYESGQDAKDRLRIGKLLRKGTNLYSSAADLEFDVLTAAYANTDIDLETFQPRLRHTDKQLQTLLCELLVPHDKNLDRIVLALTGAYLNTGCRLLDFYLRWSVQQNYSTTVVALLPRDRINNKDRVLQWEGWNEEPLFQVLTKSEFQKHLSILMSQGVSHRGTAHPPPKNLEPLSALAGYIPSHPRFALSPPPETLGLLLEVQGPLARLKLEGEVGVHTFVGTGDSLAARTKDDGVQWMVALHDGELQGYTAPDWLAKADYQFDGLPKRHYDLNQQIVRDLSAFDNLATKDDELRPVKMDRAGRWLDPMIEWHLRQRLASLLSDRWPQQSSYILTN